METIYLYNGKKCKVIRIDLLFENGYYYYGVTVNLDNFGCSFKAGSIPNDIYPNGKPYPYKELTRNLSINKALDFIIDYLRKSSRYCDEDYVNNKIDLVFNYKKQFNINNKQLTLF